MRVIHVSEVLIFLLSVLLIRCTPSTKKEHAADASDFRKGTVDNKAFGSCDTNTNNGVALRISLWKPAGMDSSYQKIGKLLDAKVIQRINSYADLVSIASQPGAENSAAQAFEVFEKNYNTFKKDFPDAPGCWEITLKGDTILLTPEAMSYQLDQYAFTGGAHPNSFRSFHVFDIKTGVERGMKTFVADSVALLDKVESAFRKIENIPAGADLEEAGYFLLNHQFALPGNYIFTRRGILFYYNPYEIAAYARGAIQFTIPYSELQNIITTDGIFQSLNFPASKKL